MASAASTLKSALETTDASSENDRLSSLRFSYRKRLAKIRRLLQERDSIEAAARNGTSVEPNPRLATLEHELNDTIESRNRIGREIDKLLGSELSEPDEECIPGPKTVDPVRSSVPHSPLLNFHRSPRTCDHCGLHLVVGNSGQCYLRHSADHRLVYDGRAISHL